MRFGVKLLKYISFNQLLLYSNFVLIRNYVFIWSVLLAMQARIGQLDYITVISSDK